MNAILPLLVMLMKIDGTPVMSVQALPAGMCQAAAAAATKQPDVVAAYCTTSAEVIDKTAAKGECEAFEVREDYVNYSCKRVPTWR